MKSRVIKTKSLGILGANSHNALSIYLNEINQVPLLTRMEEENLARSAANGEQLAKDRLVAANLRFVVNVAKKYQNQGLPLDDLISEGNIGLINAIERFDVEKGYHFISYAVWWIRQSILKAICEKSRAIRLPLNRANELVQIEKVRKELFSEKGDEPEMENIARHLGMNPTQVGDLISISRDMVSLESPVYDERDSSSVGDFVEDNYAQNPEETMLAGALREDINKVLDALTTKEKKILEHRFGLNGKTSMSLKEIGVRFDLTKERIRQIEKKAIQRLQAPSQENSLGAYLLVG